MFFQIESVADLDKVRVETQKLCIVEFTASWCSQCKMMQPVIEQIEAMYKEEVCIGIVDVDKNRDIAHNFGVISLPYFIVFHNATKVETFQMKSKTHIINMIEKYKEQK